MSHTFAPLRYLIGLRKRGDHVDSAIKAFITLFMMSKIILFESYEFRQKRMLRMLRFIVLVNNGDNSLRKTLRFYKFINNLIS